MVSVLRRRQDGVSGDASCSRSDVTLLNGNDIMQVSTFCKPEGDAVDPTELHRTLRPSALKNGKMGLINHHVDLVRDDASCTSVLPRGRRSQAFRHCHGNRDDIACSICRQFERLNSPQVRELDTLPPVWLWRSNCAYRGVGTAGAQSVG